MAESPLYSVQLAKVGEADVRGPEAFRMSRWEEWVRLVFYIVIVRAPERTILINTGPPADLTALNADWVGYLGDRRAALRVTNDECVPAVLRSHSVDPSTVDTVILTPLSAYSTGNLDLFPNAEFVISRVAWLDLMAPLDSSRAVDRALLIPFDALRSLVTDWWPRLRLVGDDEAVAAGVSVFRAGVHHKGSLAVEIATSRGTVVYSDAAYHQANIDSMCPPGLVVDLDEAFRSYARIRRDGDVILAAFDPKHLIDYPTGLVV